MRRTSLFIAILVSALLPSRPGIAGFPSTETFLPAVGRVPGQGGAQFYTTVWATNLTGAPVSFTFDFLKQGQANTSPVSFADTLSAGQTKVYENVIQSKFGIASAIGAARVVANGEILVSERIYDQPPGADVGNTEGLFFAGVPKSFSISLGQSASIQGVNQGGAENFRYNFALVETGGGSPTVNVQLFDGSGTLLGQKAYVMQPYEQLQPNVADITASVHTTNARITATVTGGSGSILLAGAQLANESQDSSGFEMSFRDQLLGGGGGTAGVTSLNGLTGAVTIAHGANTTVNVNGATITIDAVSGSGTGLTAVAHDNSLTGSGTAPVPLGIANGQVVRSLTVGGSTLHDAITLAAGSNVTLTPSGNKVTIASDLTLPFSGSFSSSATGSDFFVEETGHVHSNAIGGLSSEGTGVEGITDYGIGVYAFCTQDSGTALVAHSQYGGIGVDVDSDGIGVKSRSHKGNAIYAFSSMQNAILGQSNGGNAAGVEGDYTTSATTAGYLGGSGYGVFSHGDIKSDGGKSFVEPHPSDPTKEINYVCLEGRESGTYFRGSGRVIGGFATIEVPEDFRIVTSPKGLTVQLTPVGGLAVLAVMSQGLDRIVVQGSSDVEFHYMVNGVRKALENHAPITPNVDFVPRSAHDGAYWQTLPPESLRRMKANGTLNEDGTINLDTARRLGWDQHPGWRGEVADGAPPKN